MSDQKGRGERLRDIVRQRWKEEITICPICGKTVTLNRGVGYHTCEKTPTKSMKP